MEEALRSLRVGEVMSREPVVLPPHATVYDAVKAMAERNIGSVLVVDDGGRLVGIVTERDITRKVLARAKPLRATRLEEVMTRNPEYVTPDDTLEEAWLKMARLRVRHMPVVDPETRRPLGVVSVRDVEAVIAGHAR
jgi:CBS domain-containing protein